MTYPGDGAKDFPFCHRITAAPDLVMIEPVRQRVFQRRLQTLLYAGFWRHLQNAEWLHRARIVPLGKMVAARRFAETSLAQHAGFQQTTGERQHILRLTREQFQLQLANRLLMLGGFHLPAIERNFNLALPFADHPFFTFKIGTEQRLYVLRQIRGQFALRPDFGRQAFQRQFRACQRDVEFRTLMQSAHHAPGDFQGHFILTAIATDAQSHIVTAQPVIRRFIVNIEQLTRRRVLGIKRVKVLAQCFHAAVGDDKF